MAGWSTTRAAPLAEVIRDEDEYSGVRVRLVGHLSRARIPFHVDVNVGDPFVPLPAQVEVPRLLGGAITVRGYPLSMVFAEKIVTAVQRGTVNTRWRDYADTIVVVGGSLLALHGLRSRPTACALQLQANVLAAPVSRLLVA